MNHSKRYKRRYKVNKIYSLQLSNYQVTKGYMINWLK